LTQIHDPATGTAGAYGIITIFSMLAWGLGYFGMPHVLLRFMAIEDPNKLKLSRRIATVWVFISLGVAIFIGIVGNAMTKVGVIPSLDDPETIIIAISTVISQHGIVPALIAGLILAGILAATMSTADSQLLVASSAFTSDLYKPLIRKNKASEKETLWVGRLVVAIVSVIAFCIAASGSSWASSIMSMVENAWGLFGAAFGPVVLLSLFWRRLNYAGACSGIFAGAVVDIAWLLCFTNTITTALVAPTGIYEILPGFIAGAVTAVVVSFCTKTPSEEVDAIFAKATDPEIDE
jgi:sodium/proline symporter